MKPKVFHINSKDASSGNGDVEIDVNILGTIGLSSSISETN